MKKVKIRQDRVCYHCGGTMVNGTECFTFSSRYKGRHWLCNECVQCLMEINSAHSMLCSVQYDDEGMAHSAIDCLDEAYGEYGCREGINKNKVI